MDDNIKKQLDLLSCEIEKKIKNNIDEKYDRFRGNIYSFIDGHIEEISENYDKGLSKLENKVGELENKVGELENKMDKIDKLLDNAIKKEEVHYKDLNKLNENLYHEMDTKIKKNTLKKKTTALMKARLLKIEKKIK